ncbi:MAG: SDR family NAD(P)-dependent oxidoreductase [Myxococcales bacterium]|nr:SDR family NAD(P)-dependent oxidoreductase [Myxococcales bacterium]
MRVFEIVSATTGYPSDMLDPELDLEADLGIDTVKQAETFVAVREAFGIQRDASLQLRDYNTIEKVVDFVMSRTDASTEDRALELPRAPQAEASEERLPSRATFEAAQQVPRREPIVVLRPRVDRTTSTGVELRAGAKVLVVEDRGGVGACIAPRLEERGVEVLRLRSDFDRAELDELSSQLGDGSLTGVIWLPALDDEGPLGELEEESYERAVFVRVKALHRVMRQVYGAIEGPDTFLIGATRMGGRFGFDAEGASAALGGAVCGFVKTYARERPNALVKVVDFERLAPPELIAEALFEELHHDRSIVEVGRFRQHRIGVALAESPSVHAANETPFPPESVFLVTGAAGSITSAIVRDLAASAPRSVFHLLDLTPEPLESDEDLRTFHDDKAKLKRDLFERIQSEGEKATPAKVERLIAAIERKVSALDAIRGIRASGGRVHYHSLDLRDGQAVRAVVESIARDEGRLDVILHAAGLEISRFLPDKSPEEFDLVFDVKAKGWFNLLRTFSIVRPRVTIAFSSIAGRFGNAGQSDYASANEVLGKSSSMLRAEGVRAFVFDWTAWAGIGMATRGSIPKMMELAGIDMLDPAAGIPMIRFELGDRPGARELVVAGRLGILEEERDPAGGLSAAGAELPGPLVQRVLRDSLRDGFETEMSFNPKDQPFLDDHRIEGTAVFPGVMGIEAFVEAAKAAVPELDVSSIEDVRFLAPLKFYRDEPRTITVRLRFESRGEVFVGRARLVASRKLAGREDLAETVHFEATVVMGGSPSTPQLAGVSPEEVLGTIDDVAIYQVYFHGEAFRVLSRVDAHRGCTVGTMQVGLPPVLRAAGEAAWAPRLLELGFQTAGVEQIARRRALSLPSSIDALRFFGPSPVAERGGRAVAVFRGDGAADILLVDETGAPVAEMLGYRTIELPGSVSSSRIEPFAVAFGPLLAT